METSLSQNEDAVAKALAKNGSTLNEAPTSVVRWRSWRACQVQSLGVAVFGLLHSKLIGHGNPSLIMLYCLHLIHLSQSCCRIISR